MVLARFDKKEIVMKLLKAILIFTWLLVFLTSSVTAETICKKSDVIINKSGDHKFGTILNPPKGSDYSVWFPVVPTSLAFDSKGSIYVGDSVKYRIIKFDKDGKFIIKYSLQKPVRTKKPELSHIIQDMTVDKSECLYVVNLYEYRVEIYSADGKFIRYIDYYKDSADSTHPNKKYHPYRISVDKSSNVYLYGPKLNLIYSSNGLLKSKSKNRSAVANEKDMVGFSGYHFKVETYAPDKKLPGKTIDKLIVKGINENVITVCDNLQIAKDEEGYVYKADLNGNIYTFDYYRTINVIKIDPGLGLGRTR